MGGQFAGVEKRVKAHVLMAGFGDTARGWNLARPNDEFAHVVAPLDGIRYVGAASPSAILFQWASRDEVLTAEDLETFFNAAKEPKEKRWYDADHSFNHAALRDRAEWLGRQLAFTPPDENRLRRVHLPQRDLDFLEEQRPWFAALKRPKTKA